MKILSPSQIAFIDNQTIENEGINSIELMERAAIAFFNAFTLDTHRFDKVIHIFCGPGNNGGDGLAVGRKLIESGKNVILYEIDINSKNETPDFLENKKRLKALEKEIVVINNENDFPVIDKDDLIIDALFGIGLNRSPDGIFKKLIRHINESGAAIYAMDIPSGLFADKPSLDLDAIMKADYVFTFQVPKLSFFLPDTADFIGDFKILDIGLDSETIAEQTAYAILITEEVADNLLLKRKRFDHKGTYGHLGVVGGSYGKIGAVLLAVSGAFKSGAGLVTAIIPKCGYQITQTKIPEAMAITDSSMNELTNVEIPENIDTIAVGMGMGTAANTLLFFEKLLTKAQVPILIDADGLNCLSINQELLLFIPPKSILTPHPKELERLIGTWENDFEKIEKAVAFSKKYQVIIVIKGAFTMIVDEEKLYINTTGNPGMATAGSGDALSGIISGLLVQKYKPLNAAILGVYLHGLSGNLAAEEMDINSIMATDLIDFLPRAFKRLRK